MRIAYDYQAFTLSPYGGVSRYFVRLAENMLSLGEEVAVLAPLHRNRHLIDLPSGVVRGLHLKTFPPKSSWLISAANRIICTRQIKYFKPDLLHETYYTAKQTGGMIKARILTVYDMIHERYAHEFPANDQTAQNKRTAVARADHIICISHSTKNDLCTLLNVPEEKVSVVHLGFDRFINPNGRVKQDASKRPYLLYVGHRGGYKNFARMAKAIASMGRIKQTFSIVAFGGGPFQPAEKDLLASLGFGPTDVTQVSGDDLVLGELYRHAAAFIYPSLYEGFGIPPLEAMAQGCPVILGNTSSLPEIVGSAGEYFDPTCVEEMADSIGRVVFNEARRNELIQTGRERLNQFSWRRCATETREIYRNLL